MVSGAGQPEILRAAQRDEAFQKQLYNSASELLCSALGVHAWIRYRDMTKTATSTVYQVLTTLLNLQTLGEEYTGVVQVTPSGNSLPSKQVQVLMILFNTCGEKIFTDLLKRFEKHIDALPSDHELRPEAREQLLKASTTLRKCIPYLHLVHKAAFYLNGDYYHISKRFCGIRYALVRHWLRDRSSLPGFRLLGIISVCHLLLYALISFLKFNGTNKVLETQVTGINKTSEDADIRDKCSLCLNLRQNTSITTCGHMFCWSCIIPWLQEQPRCPLCRQAVKPSRVVLLQNYSLKS